MSEEVFSELMTVSEIVPDYWRLGQGDFADCILDSEGDWLIVFKACDVGHAKALMWIVEQWQQSQHREQAAYEAGRVEERERIVGRLKEAKEYASRAHDEATTPTLQRYYYGRLNMAQLAIAIAREEGGT